MSSAEQVEKYFETLEKAKAEWDLGKDNDDDDEDHFYWSGFRGSDQQRHQVSTSTPVPAVPAAAATTTKTSPLAAFKDRKFSVPVFGSSGNPSQLSSGSSADTSSATSVRMRDKTNSVPSRPSSLIESEQKKELKVFEVGNLGPGSGSVGGSSDTVVTAGCPSAGLWASSPPPIKTSTTASTSATTTSSSTTMTMSTTRNGSRSDLLRTSVSSEENVAAASLDATPRLANGVPDNPRRLDGHQHHVHHHHHHHHLHHPSRGSSSSTLIRLQSSVGISASAAAAFAINAAGAPNPVVGFNNSFGVSSVGGEAQVGVPTATTGATAASGAGRRCVSVNDIRRAFEKAEQSLASSVHCPGGGGGNLGNLGNAAGPSPCHNRMSSLDSTNSDESSSNLTPLNCCYGSVSSLVSGREDLKDHYGSISSLASSTSLISPQVGCRISGSSVRRELTVALLLLGLQELQGLIDEANQSLEESGTPSHEIMVIVLHREFSAGSIGITLAGGADYESKDITVSGPEKFPASVPQGHLHVH